MGDTMAKLLELQSQLEQKRGELRKFIDDHKDAKTGEWTMSADDLKAFNDRNDELTKLGKDYEALKAVADRDEQLQKEMADAEKSKTAPPPFSSKDGGNGTGPAPGAVERSQKSLGQLLIESKAFTEKAGNVGPTAALDLDTKALMATTAGWAPEVTRTGRVMLSAQEDPIVADFIPMGETGQAAVKYMEETVYTNNAAETAEGGTYPEAALQLVERDSPVRKIAVFLPITDEQLEDEPAVRDYVDSRLTLMLRQRFSQQIIAGNGIAPNLRGLNNVVGIQTQAKGADPIFDAIYKAITKLRVTGKASPSGIIMHPNDWLDVRLARTTDGLYIWGQPTEVGPERLWGNPVVKTTDMTENSALVADFRSYVMAYLRRGIEIQITNSHSTYFIEGKQAIRADFRVALVCYRPSAVCLVSGL